jgi:hypothetical protein
VRGGKRLGEEGRKGDEKERGGKGEGVVMMMQHRKERT